MDQSARASAGSSPSTGGNCPAAAIELLVHELRLLARQAQAVHPAASPAAGSSAFIVTLPSSASGVRCVQLQAEEGLGASRVRTQMGGYPEVVLSVARLDGAARSL